MKKSISIVVPILLVVGLLVAQDSFFIVNQNEQVVVVEFGRFVRTIRTPGWKFKTPFIQRAVFYDKRLLDHDIPPTEVVTKDKRTLVIDNFAKWRIVDPEKFYKRARTEVVAKDRLRDVIYSELRLDFGSHGLADIVSNVRGDLMTEVTERSNQKIHALDMGVEIVDVRIKRADLPDANQRAVFQRMSEERRRIAKEFRSEGREEALKIRAGADKEKVIILATAYKREQELRGEGDAGAIRITAKAFGKDPEFYDFIRSLEAYKKAMVQKNQMLISLDSPFLKYLK